MRCACPRPCFLLLFFIWPSGHWAVTQQLRSVSVSSRARLLLTDARSQSTPSNSVVVTQSGPTAQAHDVGEAALTSLNQSLTSLSCASQDAVWLLVLENRSNPGPVEWQRFNLLVSRSPLCVEILRVPKVYFRNFWEVKQVAVRDYLFDNPSVKFVIVTDTYDVYANPISRSELFSRFDQLTKGKARVLFATEQNCYKEFQCNASEAQQWLDQIRLGQGRHDARSFCNSQYMGERAALLAFLSDAIAIAPGVKGFSAEHHRSDQEMFARAIAARPTSVTLDFDEVIFASFFRGFKPDSNGKFTCNFGGPASMPCDVQWNWGNCTRAADGTVAIQEVAQGGIQDNHRSVAPLVWHLNGPTKTSSRRSRGCYEAFGSLPMGI